MKPFPRIVLPLIAATCFAGLSAQDLAQYKDGDPKALYQRAMDSPSIAEKVAIRTFLLRTVPDSEYGCLSRAWLSGYEEDGHAREFYEKCAASYPDSLLIHWNLQRELPPKEGIAALQRVLEIDPSFVEYGAIRSIYFLYRNDLKDPAAARAFLAQWEAKLPGIFIFDFVRGLEAQYNDKDWSKAKSFYDKVIAKNPGFLEVREKIVDADIARLAQEGKDQETQAGAVAPLVDFIRQFVGKDRSPSETVTIYSALMYGGDILDKRLNTKAAAFQLYKQAFSIYPAVEAVDAGVDAARVPADAEEFVKLARDALPTSPEILVQSGKAETDPAAVRDYYDQAIHYSLTLKDEFAAARALAGDLLEDRLADYDAAAEIYRKYLAKLPNKGGALDALYENRREAGKYTEARKYLDDYEATLKEKSGVNEAWFRSHRRELEEFLAAEASSDAFYKRNPFLRSWRQQFGDGLQTTIHFAPGSDAILQRDFPTLATIAEALNQQGAEQYIFSVDGYGPDAASARRIAQAVVDHLNRVHGIPLTRLRIGIGAASGIASTDASARRVEILPVGNTAEPAIVATPALNAESMLAMAPGGRYMAPGQEPMEIWDVEQGVRLKTLDSCGYRAFSPNARYLACTSSYTDAGGYKRYAILVYDVATGLRIAQIALWNETARLAWNPQSTQIVFTTDKPQIVIYDITAKRRVRVAGIPGAPRIVSKGVVWTRNGKYIVTGLAQAKELIVWNPADLSIVRKLTEVDWPHSLAETADGRYLVCSDNKFTVTVWDEATFKSRQFKTGLESSRMSVHPTKPLVLLGDFSNVGHQKLILFDVARMAIVATRETGSAEAEAFFTSDGSRVLSAEGNRIFVLDPATLKQTGEVTGTAEPALAGASSAKNGYYLVLDRGGVHVWDITTGRKVHVWRQKVDKIVALEDSGQFLAFRLDAEAKTTAITLLDVNTFEASAWGSIAMTADRISVTKRWVAIAGTPILPPNTASETGTVSVYDRATHSLAKTITIPMVTAALAYDKIYSSGFGSLALTESGDEAAVVSHWQDGFGHASTYSRLVRLFNMATGELRQKLSFDTEIAAIAFEGEADRFVAVTVGPRTEVYQRSDATWVRNGEKAAFESALHMSSGMSAGVDLYWCTVYVRIANTVTPMKIIHAALFEQQNLLVTLNSRNEIVFHDLKTLDPRLTIVNKKGGEWIAYAPTGEFASSLHGADKVYWSLVYQYLDFSSLRERFEQPKVIVERLKGVASGTSVATAAAPGINPEVFALPYSLEVVSKNNFETTAASYDLELRVTKQRADLPDPVILWTQQNRAVETSKSPHVPSSGPIVRRTFDLAEDVNVIQANISFQGATIPGPIVIVKRNVPRLAAGAKPDTSMWFFGVGISKYVNQSKISKLNFADRDVQQVSDLMKGQEGKLYNNVNTKLLLNGDAKAQDVRVQMNAFLRQASDKDVVLIMLSAHGIAESGELYLVTNDADPEQPYTGLNLAELHNLLMKRPPNQKAIVWIDICHAGAFGPGNTSAKGRVSADDAIKELAQGTGLIVLASSTASEESLESSQYGGGHGAFSAAIIEALSGRTRTRGASDDGKLTLLQLHSYVAERVPAMTNGRQHPTVPEAQQLRDFPIALPFN